jgi:hypothetical protein
MIQINLTGFLEKNAADFMRELWTLLLSAQDSATGIPREFLEKKKQEIAARKVTCFVKKIHISYPHLFNSDISIYLSIYLSIYRNRSREPN